MGNSVEMSMKSRWNFNEIPLKVLMKYQSKSIGNPVEILMKYQWRAIVNPVKIQ